jgi:Tfp pilus assembly protein PilX
LQKKRQVRPARARSKRGLVLVLTLFFMMILGLLSVALFAIVPQDLRQSLRYESDLQAHYAVTAGIKHATAFLSSAMNPAAPSLATPMASTSNGWSESTNPFGVPTSGYDYANATCSNPGGSPWNMAPMSGSDTVDPQPTTNNTFFYNGMPYLRLNPNVLRLNGDWCVDVAVFPDKYTAPHGFVAQTGSTPLSPAYTVVALAFHDYNGNGIMDGGNEHYVLRAKANMAVSSFARYAFFADKWDPNQYLTLQTQTAGSSSNRPLVDGPFHTNGYPQLYSQGGAAFWSQTPAAGNTFTPMFTGSLTYSAAGG